MSGSEQIEDLVDRLHLDQRARWLAGERLPAERYLDRYPALATNRDGLILLVYGEYCLRDDLADAPGPQEYLVRFPQIADDLSSLLDVDRELTSSGLAAVTGPSFPQRLNWPGKSKPLVLIDDRPDAAFPPSVAGLGALRPGYIFYSLTADPSEDESRCSGVDAYIPLNIVGRGGTGVVYTARRRGTDETVTLKFITLGPYENAELALFVATVRDIAGLAHPGLMAVKEVSNWNGLPYLVEERVEGQSLAAYLQNRPLTPVQATRIIVSVSQTLTALHSAGFVHGNLKPANVLLADSGQHRLCDAGIVPTLPKAANFGCLIAEPPPGKTVPERMRQLSRAVRRPAETALVRHDWGYLLGHPACLAPELLDGGSVALGSATDVYALGAVWYTALTGRQPFQGQNWRATLEEACQRDVPAPSAHRPVPAAIDQLVVSCLSKQAGARPSAAELAKEASSWLALQPEEPG